MKFVILLFVSLFVVPSFGYNKNSFRSFSQYYQRTKLNYELSEKRLIAVGETHLKKHVEISELLSLAELLPKEAGLVSGFCKSYPADVVKYYNLKNAKNLKNVTSASFKEFNAMVIKECKKK